MHGHNSLGSSHSTRKVQYRYGLEEGGVQQAFG